MRLTQSDLVQIVAQASSLSERLSNNLFKVNAIQLSEQWVIDDRLNRWCQLVAQANWEKFQQRLEWDEWNIDTVRPALGTVHLTDSQALPKWVQTLREIIQTASEWGMGYGGVEKSPMPNAQLPITTIPIDPEKPLPFEDVLLPALWVARQQLLTRLGSASLSPEHLPLELLSEKAYLTLERDLLVKVVHLCVKTLEFEFSHSRPLGYSLVNLLIKQTKDSKSKVHYNAFVQKLLQDGLLTFFQKYPVLGRLVATQIDFWVEATAEFLQRLKCDWESEIGDWGQYRVSKVIEIKPSLSDPHHQGRCAIALTLDSGLKLVYKPKDLVLEVAYNQFLDWCNHQGKNSFFSSSQKKASEGSVPLPFKVLKVLNRGTHGWVEYVEQYPCEDEAAAQRFYQRAGMLLCLLYALGGTDCHYENLIASGEHLVLVDMETLMHHQARLLENSSEIIEAGTAVNQKFWDSVLRTGLLPRWDFNTDNRIAYDVSGLGSVGLQQAPRREPRWQSVNTDDMHLAYETVMIPVQRNVPILNGVALSPNNYVEECVEGFRQMYHFLIEQRQALLAETIPLAAFQAQRVRFIFRSTEIYRVILQRTLAPELLRNGVDHSIAMDILSRAFLTTQDKPNTWSILQAELKAIEQLDIPYFGANSDSDALTIGVEPSIAQCFEAPSYSQVMSRLQNLNEIDLAQQVAMIQGAFYAKVVQNSLAGQALEPDASVPKEADLSKAIPLTSEQLLQQASHIAQEIHRTAISRADSSITWIGFGYIPKAERFQLMLLDDNLYDGTCGIALFLAALDYVRGSTQFHNLALGALKSLRKLLQTSNAKSAQGFARVVGIGGAMGVSGVIYSLVRTSQFLKEVALLEDAQRAANLITPELIAADQQFDVMGGTAGAILGLLALYSETANSGVLEQAVTCGQHLLKHRISIEGSPRAWKTFEEKRLTGFSHGAAGIAYALLRLYAVTQDIAYLEAAEEGIAYERSVFSSTAANWPDFRFLNEQNGQPGFMVSWCHGAAGIALGRLGSLSILETEEIHHDVEVGLQTAQKYDVQDVDHLCCGNCGRIELLLVASQKLSCPQLRERAQQRAAWVVARVQQIGAYQLFTNLPSGVFSPSFFQGTAGIGYELLRLAYPEALPSVLLWE